MKNKKGNITVIALIITIVAITAGVIGFLFAKKTQAPASQVVATQLTAAVAQTQAIAQQPLQQADETADRQTYTNTKYGFEIKFSDAWKNYKVVESKNDDEIATLTVQYPNFLEKNDKYVFTYRGPQDVPNDFGGSNMEGLKILEFDRVLSTFKFTK